MFIYFFIQKLITVSVSDEDNGRITNEEVVPLATLPKLEILSLWNINSITGQIFEQFSTLKVIKSSAIRDIGQGICHLIRRCKNLELIVLLYYSDNDMIDMFKCLCQSLNHRTNCNPLLIGLYSCSVQITPIPKVYNLRKNPSKKYHFEIYEVKYKEHNKGHAPVFECYNEEIFLNEISSWMEWYNQGPGPE